MESRESPRNRERAALSSLFSRLRLRVKAHSGLASFRMLSCLSSEEMWLAARRYRCPTPAPASVPVLASPPAPASAPAQASTAVEREVSPLAYTWRTVARLTLLLTLVPAPYNAAARFRVLRYFVCFYYRPQTAYGDNTGYDVVRAWDRHCKFHHSSRGEYIINQPKLSRWPSRDLRLPVSRQPPEGHSFTTET